MTQGFYQTAHADPDRLAIVDTDGTRLTFGELLAKVNQVSNGLRALGLQSGDLVASILPNGVDVLVMQLATGQIGLYLVPINWHFTAAEIGYILADSSAAAVVAGQEFTAAVGAAADTAGLAADRRFAHPGAPGFRPFADLAAGMPDTAPPDRALGQLMLYTSGTTGRPKGVRLPLVDTAPEPILEFVAAGLVNTLGLDPTTGVHLVTAPQYHASPGVHALFALHLGHTVVISPKFEPETVLDLIQRYQVTNTFMVPTMFHRLLALPEGVRASYDTSSLRQVMHAAAMCPVATKHQMIDWVGPVLDEYYGSTESAIVTAVGSREWLEHPGTVGRAVPGIDIKILDEAGAELPAGEPGLIYTSTAARFEYHNDPAKTAGSKRGAYYTPGDIGYLDKGGHLFLCDRRSDLIISGGVNIYPAEIEAALLEHPSVRDAAVFGVPDPEWGHQVVALVEPAPEAVFGDALRTELLAHCAARLARFKHPRVLELRESLPRTPTGKLSRSRVRDDYLAAGSR